MILMSFLICVILILGCGLLYEISVSLKEICEILKRNEP